MHSPYDLMCYLHVWLLCVRSTTFRRWKLTPHPMNTPSRQRIKQKSSMRQKKKIHSQRIGEYECPIGRQSFEFWFVPNTHTYNVHRLRLKRIFVFAFDATKCRRLTDMNWTVNKIISINEMFLSKQNRVSVCVRFSHGVNGWDSSNVSIGSIPKANVSRERYAL